MSPNDEMFEEACAKVEDTLLALPLSRVMDLADEISGIHGGCGLTPAQMRWTKSQIARTEIRSIAQAYQDALDRLSAAVVASGGE